MHPKCWFKFRSGLPESAFREGFRSRVFVYNDGFNFHTLLIPLNNCQFLFLPPKWLCF